MELSLVIFGSIVTSRGYILKSLNFRNNLLFGLFVCLFEGKGRRELKTHPCHSSCVEVGRQQKSVLSFYHVD